MAYRASHIDDFGSLREGFAALSEIYSLNGTATPSKKGIQLSGIPRDRWGVLVRAVKSNESMIKSLIQGTGQRSSVQGRREVVVAVIAKKGQPGVLEVTFLLVKGRGAVERSLTVSSNDEAWRDRLFSFVDWDEISGVIPAAEGNNQRAMIGMVLQIAGIGRGKLEIVEAEIPEEVDEAAQSVRGADWLKAGLPRFECAAGEALWYLMRMRSVHARMIRVKKQGYYTSMALGAMYASGLTVQEISRGTGMSEGIIDKLLPKPGKEPAQPADVRNLGGSFQNINPSSDPERLHCLNRVWKGASIYVRILDRRVRVGSAARARIGAGDDIVSVARELKIPRRDLIRVLSVSQADAIAERERFVSAIIDPDLVRRVSLNRSNE